MKRVFTLLPLLLWIFTVCAQEQVDLPMMQKIKDEAAKNSQIPELARYLTEVCGPRLTNSQGYRRAVAWSIQTLQGWGINAKKEAWGEFGKGWTNEHTYLALKAPYYAPMIAYPWAWTMSTPGKISSKVVMLESLDTASIDKAGAALKGKIVMVRPPDSTLRSNFNPDARRYADNEVEGEPEVPKATPENISRIRNQASRNYNIKRYLEEKGALALLTGNPRGRDGTVYVGGELSYATGYNATLPHMAVLEEDYLRLYRFLSRGEHAEVEMEVKNSWLTDDLNGYNVIAEIGGTDAKLKEEVVMLGAHLDSWHSGTGATDNAAGCVVMMEAVRILKALGVQPKRTIRLALWGGEEQGLQGSFGYVKKHFGNPRNMNLLPEQQKISAYYNLDVGTGKIRGIYLQGNEQLRSIFGAWLQPFDSLGAKGVNSNRVDGTDHLSFEAVGIPAFQFIQDPMEYFTRTHHSNMDVYDHLSMDDLKQAATVIAAFVYNTAMRDGMLPRLPLPKPAPFLLEERLR